MEIIRESVTPTGSEREMLVSYLAYERATLALKLGGLTFEQAARQSVPPSTMSLLGLIRHMTDVEKNWMVGRFQGRSVDGLYRTPEDSDAAFNDLKATDVEEALDRWRLACEESCQIVDETVSLDQLSVGTRRGGEHVSMRWTILHLIEEYARHAGHADLLRESIDGEVGM